jgi:hypothetical protein
MSTLSHVKRDFLEFFSYLEKMAIIHDEYCHQVDHKKMGDCGTKNMSKNSDAGGQSSGTTLEDAPLEVALIRHLTVIERS